MSSNTFGYIADTGPTQAFGNLPRKYNPVKATISIEYLVVAGGGGSSGGNDAPGGGGAGGFRTNVSGATSGGGASAEPSMTLTQGQSFTVTVGAGVVKE